MRVREMPATLALGLLASLLAHTLLYGGQHVMGGAYGDLLLELAAIAGGAGAVLAGGLAWAGARACADGSILAARLGRHMPGLPGLALASGLWFALGERIEPVHAFASLPLTVLYLVAAAWTLRFAVAWAIGHLARAAVALTRPAQPARALPAPRRLPPPPGVRTNPALRRRFTRPPPIPTCA